MTNSRGDVEYIYNTSGTLVAQYTYDAWGNVLTIKDGSGAAITSTSHIGNINPIRYRGYYYDVESGLYYLNSRYYDAEVGRFISADGEMSGLGETVQGYNLFAYCMNNPVNMDDAMGNWPKWLTGTLNIIGGSLQVATGAILGSTVGWTGVGAVVAGVTYDCAVVAGNAYAGTTILDANMPKILDSKLFTQNNGYGIKVGNNIEMLYRNPNAEGGVGGTFFSYKGTLGKFKIDWDPTHHFHSHPPGHK